MWILEIERAFPAFRRQLFERLDCKQILMPWGSVLITMYAVCKGTPPEPILWAICDRKSEFEFVVRIGTRVEGRRGLTIRVVREIPNLFVPTSPLAALLPVVQEIEEEIRASDPLVQWTEAIARAELEGVVFHDSL